MDAFRRILPTAAAALAVLSGCRSDDSTAIPRNLLLITVDTLRADHLGLYGHAGPISPRIDAWGSSALVFEEAHAPSSWTLASLASLMTSGPSSRHGCWDFKSSLDDSALVLAEVLDQQGFRTEAVASHLFLAPKFGLDQGFDDYDVELVKPLMRSHEAISSPEVALRGVERLERLARSEDRWFLWLHFFDPHEVYHAHEGFWPQGDRGEELDRYKSEVAFTDDGIGRVLDALVELDLAAETAVVLTADHGEEWLDHGALRHGHSLHRELVHVPLVLGGPGVEPGRTALPASLVDVAPTLCDWLDVDAPGAFLGDVLPLSAGTAPGDLTDRPLLEELRLREKRRFDGLRRGRWHLIIDRKDDSASLFDLLEDPTEQDDRAALEPELVAELVAQLEGERARYQGGGGSSADLSADDVQRLIDLGYAEPADLEGRDGD